jgi:hypothetical protein
MTAEVPGARMRARPHRGVRPGLQLRVIGRKQAGGVGEHSSEIGAHRSPVRTLVLQAHEDLEMARQTVVVLIRSDTAE